MSNLCSLNTYTLINRGKKLPQSDFHIDNNIIKSQEILKNIDNSKCSELFQNVLKAVMEARDVIPCMCNTVNQWSVNSSSKIEGDDIVNFSVNNFLNRLKERGDFRGAYIFNEDSITNVWIITDELDFDETLEYMREYNNTNSDDSFNIMLFEEDEKNDMIKQIKFIVSDYERDVKEVNLNVR